MRLLLHCQCGMVHIELLGLGSVSGIGVMR